MTEALYSIGISYGPQEMATIVLRSIVCLFVLNLKCINMLFPRLGHENVLVAVVLKKDWHLYCSCLFSP